MAEIQNEFTSYGFNKLTCLKLSFYFDIISGLMFTVIGLAEFSGLTNPDPPVIATSQYIMTIACGVLGITAGSLGLIGIQTRSLRRLVYTRNTRVVQILLVLIANLIVLFNLDDIPEQITPKILRASIDVHLSLPLACLSSVIFWTTLWMYGIVLVQRLIRVIKAGSTPTQSAIVFVSGPTGLETRTDRRVQYESPLLQGRIVTVPTSIE